jgi:PPOX class probable F420-dependent enzyme
MLGTPEQDAFINSQKWASVTTLRADGSPTNSIIFFAREGDTLYFSTTESRLKTKTLRRDPRIAVCVLDEGAPYRFVNVEGVAVIEDQDVVPGHIEINRVMRGEPDWQPPEGFAERLKNDGRVIVKVNATRVSGVVNR